MKNREKYKNELMDVIKMDGNTCGFVIKHEVTRMFGTEMESFCGETDCNACGTALQLWLDEEYEEPPKPEVDWSKVPVDTLVRVRDGEDEEWILRYFKGINEDSLRRRYEAWESGATSKTADDCTEYWKYCELAEEEDDEVLNKSDNCPFMEVEDGSN